jgi:hypothetical protein
MHRPHAHTTATVLARRRRRHGLGFRDREKFRVEKKIPQIKKTQVRSNFDFLEVKYWEQMTFFFFLQYIFRSWKTWSFRSKI